VLSSSEEERESALSVLYRYLGWPMDPRDPEAIGRFEAIMRFFLEKLGNDIPYIEDAAILDVAGGTGIASLALAEALMRKGAKIQEVVITDVRGEDLDKAEMWLQERGLKDVRVRTVNADATRLVERIRGRYNYILLWGSSLPHFSTWDYALIVANTRELICGEGVFMVEQKNLLPRILHSNAYKEIHLAPGKSKGTLVASILTGYDDLAGMDIKQQYLIPGFHYIGETRSRLWDLATALTITWLFYQDVKLLKSKERLVADVIIALRPRKDSPSAQSLLNTIIR